jgi:hypothetical protein
MLPVSDNLRAAIDARVRRPAVRVVCDWDRDGLYDHEYSDISGLVTGITVNRGCSTFMPEELNTAGGYSSGEMKLTLGGRAGPSMLTAFELFGGGAKVSPLWGRTNIGVRILAYSQFVTDDGVQETPVFSGWIRELPVSRLSRQVELVANDNLDLVNSSITLPLWATGINSPYANWDNGEPEITRHIAASWVWEEILRRAGRLVAPAIRDDAVAHWSMSGSMIPSVGSLRDEYATGAHPILPVFVPEFYDQTAPFGMGTPDTSGASELDFGYSRTFCTTSDHVHVPTTNDTARPAKSVSFGGWFKVSTSGDPNISGIILLSLERASVLENGTVIGGQRAHASLTVNADGSMSSEVWSGTGTPPKPHNSAIRSTPISEGGWHYFSTTIDITGTSPYITHRMSIDGVAVSSTSTDITLATLPTLETGYLPYNRTNPCQVVTAIPTHHVSVWAGYPTDGDARYVQQAQLTVPTMDNGAPMVSMTRSIAELAWIPDVQDGNPWETLKESVGAEYGALWIDALGTVQIRQRAEIGSAQSIVVDDDTPRYTDDVVGEITLTPRIDTKRNVVNVPGRFRNAEEKIVWKNQNAKDYLVPAGDYVDEMLYPLKEVIATSQWLAASSAAAPTSSETVDVSKSYGTAIKAADVNQPASAGWAFDFQQFQDQRYMHLHVHASPSEDNYVGSYIGATQPSLLICGRQYSDVQKVAGSAEDSVDIAAYGRLTLTVPESDWMQTPASCNAVAESLVALTHLGTVGISDVELPHDPTRELFDIIVLTNEAGADLGQLVCQVMGIDVTGDSSSGFRDTLTLRLLYVPGLALWDNEAAGWENGWSA